MHYIRHYVRQLYNTNSIGLILVLQIHEIFLIYKDSLALALVSDSLERDSNQGRLDVLLVHVHVQWNQINTTIKYSNTGKLRR